MNNNQVISEWRGECRHEWELTRESDFPGEDAHIWTCKLCGEEEPSFLFKPVKPECPSFDYTDPAAWDEALYQEISDGDLWKDYAGNLMPKCWQDCPMGMICNYVDFMQLTATPAQKASALAKAIREGK